MSHKKEIISTLNGLIERLNDGREGSSKRRDIAAQKYSVRKQTGAHTRELLDSHLRRDVLLHVPVLSPRD